MVWEKQLTFDDHIFEREDTCGRFLTDTLAVLCHSTRWCPVRENPSPKTHLKSAFVVLSGSGKVPSLATSHQLGVFCASKCHVSASLNVLVAPVRFGTVSTCSMHHQYSGSVSPLMTVLHLLRVNIDDFFNKTSRTALVRHDFSKRGI